MPVSSQPSVKRLDTLYPDLIAFIPYSAIVADVPTITDLEDMTDPTQVLVKYNVNENGVEITENRTHAPVRNLTPMGVGDEDHVSTEFTIDVTVHLNGWDHDTYALLRGYDPTADLEDNFTLKTGAATTVAAAGINTRVKIRKEKYALLFRIPTEDPATEGSLYVFIPRAVVMSDEVPFTMKGERVEARLPFKSLVIPSDADLTKIQAIVGAVTNRYSGIHYFNAGNITWSDTP